MSFKLSSEQKMPLVGLGTYKNKDPKEMDIIKEAVVNIGYRHIDTASHYENEELIGQQLSEIFATTKIEAGGSRDCKFIRIA